jgi:glycosyltransferase involved in cell wall biosynthesis
LLATYNGERFLRQQLDSIAQQTHAHWVVHVSDDGSTDGTLGVLAEYQALWGQSKLQIRKGPQQGLCANFMSMVLDPNIDADFFALCDQDDVWLPTKLQRALALLSPASDTAQAQLYCARTRYVSASLHPLGLSRANHKPAGFRNALVQSLAGGNTMVFNRAGKTLAMQAGVLSAVVHDWWLYLLVTGAGGRVVFDQEAHILYRQHDNAIIGSADGVWDRVKRLGSLVLGRHKAYAATNILALQQAQHCLLDTHVQALHDFEALHNEHSLLKRLRLFQKLALYRQTLAGEMSLRLAVLLGKI